MACAFLGSEAPRSQQFSRQKRRQGMVKGAGTPHYSLSQARQQAAAHSRFTEWQPEEGKPMQPASLCFWCNNFHKHPTMVRGVEQHSVPACRLKTAKLREHILQISAFAINPALAPQPHKSHQPGGGGAASCLLPYLLLQANGAAHTVIDSCHLRSILLLGISPSRHDAWKSCIINIQLEILVKRTLI